ncbi:MAG: hypothetical protein COB85_09890, partial [Bacteroidetes bacterium]
MFTKKSWLRLIKIAPKAIFFHIIILNGFTNSSFCQFSIVSTGTNTSINSIKAQGDTIVLSGLENYFAKSFDTSQSVISYTAPGLSGYNNYDLAIVTTGEYFIVSGLHSPTYNYKILKSTNSGLNWNTIFDTTGMTVLTFSMLDAGFGIGAGNFGDIIITNDSGGTWAYSNLGSNLMFVASKSFNDSTLALGAFEYLAVSNDRGQNWMINYFNQSDPSAIHFVNKDTIYVTSYFWNGWESFFTKSYDGGNSWQTISLGQGFGVYDLFFDTPEHGYIVGHNYNTSEGVVFETNNYGDNWAVFATGVNSEFLEFISINDSMALISGTNGILLKWDKIIPLNITKPSVHIEFSIY